MRVPTLVSMHEQSDGAHPAGDRGRCDSSPPAAHGTEAGDPVAGRPPSVSAVDDDVWPLLVAGRPEAVERLYERYGALAYTLAHRVLRDPGAAEDVVQDAFLAMWRNARTYSVTRGSLRSWLCTIVRNRAIDRMRGRAGRSRLDVPLDVTADRSDGVDVADRVVERFEAERVRLGLSTLSAPQRQTLELAYYGGLSQTEIAGQMNVPLGTVKGRTRAGLQRLRALLLSPA
jgi:RNA polymerase sigma-70 factor, ECF subfamily